MKKLTILFLLIAVWTTTFAQNPSYQQKLYYTCKVWGFVKYYHSKVSICQVKWDSALLSTLPLVKNAVTSKDFNDALLQMLQAAGPMAIAPMPLPDTLPVELKRNRNFGWINDPIFRNDVKVILDTIKNNFRPHPICWVEHNSGTGNGWLAFPYDDPILNSNLSTNFPDEYTRLMIIFRYWNIMNYFNPNNYILDKPWDSTLYNSVLPVAIATNYTNFFLTFRKMAANLNDTHTESWTNAFLPSYMPKLALWYTQGNYVVVKSGYPQINKGDIIVSIDGKTTVQWEDSLRPYVSAGNSSVFRGGMCSYLLRGASGSLVKIEYQDSLGNVNTYSTYRYTIGNSAWLDWNPNEALVSVKWKKWNCNVGYVNMGILQTSDVNAMYSDLQNTTAIIFDIRHYPNGTIGDIADLIYPNNICNALFTCPDVEYPGTFYWGYQYLGNDGNPLYYKGKVIILCNQETMSQAEFSCMTLKAMPNSVIVGSQTAGADGNITSFKLSQDIYTGFTSLGVYYPDGTQTQRIGIVPDSIVYPTAEGIRHGSDEVLEKALEIAGCDTATSVKELNPEESELYLFPNPTSDNILISFSNSVLSNMTISIFNSLGIEIIQFDEKELLGQNTVSFSIESLPPGIYYCTMNNGTNKIAKSFVVVNRNGH